MKCNAMKRNATRDGDAKRIMLVDDHPLVRAGLAALIAAQSGMCVCCEAASVAEAWQKMEMAEPDLLIVDLSLPGPNGMELIRDLPARYPNVLVLALSMHDEADYAERTLRAGARGYLMKSESPTRIVEAIQTVLRGELFVSSRMCDQLLKIALNGRPSGSTDYSPRSRLTDREIETFEAIGNGLSTKQIGRKYSISPKTVETHRAHIKRKLGLATNHALLHSAFRWVDGNKVDDSAARTDKTLPPGIA